MIKKLLSFPFKFAEGFIEDDGYLEASALSFYTLLSIIPIFAIIFGIAKGFGFENALEKELLDIFYQQPQFAEKLISFAKSTLENAHGTLIAGVGIISLFWTAIGLLGSFESALNKIWNVPNMRTWQEKITAYLPLLIFGPIIVILASSSAYLIIAKISEYFYIKPIIHIAYSALLICFSWILFLFLFTYMPNKPIPWKSCIFASFITSVAFQAAQWAYIHLQIYLTSYNAIYGSFAAIPLFLIWLRVSWLIILAGAEFAKQHSNFGQKAAMPISERGLFLLAMLNISRFFKENEPPCTIEKLSKTLAISRSLAEKIIARFKKSGLLLETTANGFIPAMPLDQIMISNVLEAVDETPDQLFHVNDSYERNQVLEILTSWDIEQRKLTSNTSMEKLLIL